MRMRRRSLPSVMLLPVVLAGGAASPVLARTRCAPGSDGASRLSCRPVLERSRWRQQVLDSPRAVVRATRVRVLSSPVSVGNSDALATGHGSTILRPGARLVLDLGTNVGGRVELTGTASGPVRLALGYSEARRYLTARGDVPAGALGQQRADEITAPAGPVRWESAGIRGAQRWIELTLTSGGPVRLDRLDVRVGNLRPAVRDYVGRFLSSDRTFNRVWWAGAYTFDLDTTRNSAGKWVVLDGAKRDRFVWSGDLGVEGLTAYSASRAAPAVIRASLLAFACQQETNGYLTPASIPSTTCPLSALADPFHLAPPFLSSRNLRLGEYVPAWIVALSDYERYTGDRRFVRALLPTARRAMRWFEGQASAGLYRESARFGAINWHPYDRARGADGMTNALYYQALIRMAGLERRLGAGSAAARSDLRRATAVRAAVTRQLWDPRARAMLVNTAARPTNHTQDANVYAALSGVLDRRRSEQALAYVSGRLQTRFGPVSTRRRDDPWMSHYISPYITSWELWARYERGETGAANAIIHRLYGHMAAADPGTLWEKVAVNGVPEPYREAPIVGHPRPRPLRFPPGQTSLAHGWSTGPTSALSAFVLGIRPTACGFSTLTVAPQLGDLRWAQGQIGTPHGPVVSRWQHDRRPDRFRLTVRVPRGTTATVVVPLLGRRRRIALDGRIVWAGIRAAGGAHGRRTSTGVAFRGIRGMHTFAWSGRA